MLINRLKWVPEKYAFLKDFLLMATVSQKNPYNCFFVFVGKQCSLIIFRLASRRTRVRCSVYFTNFYRAFGKGTSQRIPNRKTCTLHIVVTPGHSAKISK